ncbi:hypothetical protein HA402_006592 [Bradysia odoriphaga]|nr:hypothetical protein HA402_006592 [Bradysia odoriphaga]
MSNFNSSDLLHPDLMETSLIIEYLKHRQLAIPNIEQKSRDELLKIFHSYAMPLHQRLSTRTKASDNPMDTLEIIPNVELTNKAGSRHKRIVYESDITQRNGSCNNNVPMITNGCKRLKIEAIDEGVSKSKRELHDTKIDCSPETKPKRQKITWP